MGRAISLLAAVFLMAATPQAASAHPIGLGVAPLRGAAPPARHLSRAQRHDDAFTLVDAGSGAIVRSRPNGAIAGELPGRTPLGTTTWLWATRTSRDGRWARVILPWRPNGRTGWISLRGRTTVKSRVWVEAHVSSRRREPDGRQPCDALVRRRRRRSGLSHADRPVQRHRPDRHRRSGRPLRVVCVRASPATSPTFPPAGRVATSSPSTARTPRRRSERPPPRVACGSRRPRSASSSATCARARRSSSRRSRLPRGGLRLRHGTWRSLVAHLLWEQGVASSNLAVPIAGNGLNTRLRRFQ